MGIDAGKEKADAEIERRRARLLPADMATHSMMKDHASLPTSVHTVLLHAAVTLSFSHVTRM